MLFIESRSVRGFIVYAMIVQAKHTNQTFQRLCDLIFPSAQKRKRIAVKVESDKISEAAREYRNPGFKIANFH
jgi:hypothetical protein